MPDEVVTDAHRDPFDRVLAAQAITERLHLATVDVRALESRRTLRS
jgi:PIN domain nuclease of toxin-antitoxin system